MEGYLGEKELDLSKTKYYFWNRNDWAIFWVEMYGQIDGDHHKQWLIDQVMRILQGTKVIVSQASWKNGHTEDRFALEEVPSFNYQKFVMEYEDGDKYEWDQGIAP